MMHRLRRTLLAIGLGLGLAATAALTPTSAAAADPTLYVYLPTTVKARTLQAQLEGAMPGVTVTVFGRITDLDRAMADARPDAVLALRPVIESRGMTPDLQGVKGGTDTEVYVVVGPQTITPEQLTGKVVGSLDLLGRRHMDGFVAVLLGERAQPDVKRVRSTEDLLPLLQFQAADVVMLPESAVQDLMGASQLDLTVTHVDDARVGLAAVSFIDSADRPAIETAIKSLPDAARGNLGIDTWRAQ